MDVLKIGKSIRVCNQTLGLATAVSSDWAAIPVDGVMGISPGSDSAFVNQSMSVFDNLVASETLASPVIGIALVKASAQKAGSPAGEFTFGGVSDKWIPGGGQAIAWKNVTSNQVW